MLGSPEQLLGLGIPFAKTIIYIEYSFDICLYMCVCVSLFYNIFSLKKFRCSKMENSHTPELNEQNWGYIDGKFSTYTSLVYLPYNRDYPYNLDARDYLYFWSKREYLRRVPLLLRRK